MYGSLAGALVFNDTLWPQLNTSALRNFNWTQLQKVLNRTKASSNWKSFDVNETMKKLLQTESGNGVVSQITFLFNTTSDHSLPALIQELAQARLQAAVKNNSTSFLVSSHPLPLTKNESLKLQTVLTVLAALFILIPFCYLAASFAVFVVRERIVKAKLLQVKSFYQHQHYQQTFIFVIAMISLWNLFLDTNFLPKCVMQFYHGRFVLVVGFIVQFYHGCLDSFCCLI
jgi:hypothetical protein